MKVAVIGSRDFKNLHWVTVVIKSLPKETEIVSGAAKGVDSHAAYVAKALQMPLHEIPVEDEDWKKYGKVAGHMRNTKICEYADMGIAFWDGKSTGTANCVEQMNGMSKNTFVISKDSDVESVIEKLKQLVPAGGLNEEEVPY